MQYQGLMNLARDESIETGLLIKKSCGERCVLVVKKGDASKTSPFIGPRTEKQKY
jgi:hypothetical protein